MSKNINIHRLICGEDETLNGLHILLWVFVGMKRGLKVGNGVFDEDPILIHFLQPFFSN